MDALTLGRGEHWKPPSLLHRFICLHDPFGAGLPVYTLDMKCQEAQLWKRGHGFVWIALSACLEKLPWGACRATCYTTFQQERPAASAATKPGLRHCQAANGNGAWRKEKMALLTFEET